jgi:DNA-binding LacI/PurR family transcriptional regulator
MQTKIRTLSDLAKIAGVSESTASRALNNNTLISEKTRKKIQQLAAEYGFRINSTARNLRLQKSNTIAVVILRSSELDQAITDPFILDIVGVIAEQLSLRKYDVLLVSRTVDDVQPLSDYFNMKRADGLIVFGQGDDYSKFEGIIDKQYPLVVWGAQSETHDYVTVGTDNHLGGKLATQHLLEKGCQKIAFSGHLSYETGLRFRGYQEALSSSGLTPYAPLEVHFTFEDAYRVTQALIQQGNFDYDGIVAASDTIALGTIRALTEANIQVPQQVAVVGYDDIPVGGYTQPSLTSVRQNTQEGGKTLVDSLLKQLQGQLVDSTLLETELVIRNSSNR